MIARQDQAPTSGTDGMQTLHLSVAGGLTQFGAYIDTLAPGARSSRRHWHDSEDEFLLVLDGTPTVIDNFGSHDLAPGDAVCWAHGNPNAHHVLNTSAAPCRTLIVGSRVAGDICHYPDSGDRQVNGETHWQVQDRNGTVLREGPLPPELIGLPGVWGKPWGGAAQTFILRAKDQVWAVEDAYTHPILGGGLGRYDHIILGDQGGLTQFGVHLERLPPGSASSFRHWHEAEDELVLVLSGQPTLIEDDETLLQPGDMACWPAGLAVGHCLQNRTAEEAVYLTIGTRHIRDVIHYPNHDLITRKDGPTRAYTHANGIARTA